MKRVLQPFGIFIIALALSASSAGAQDDPKPDKPAFGDKDDVTLQNKRVLKIRNETGDTLTVFLQFRAPQEGGWVWIPDNPAETTDALSFEIEAGKELDVKHKDELVAASRMRIWASSPTQKWLQFKTKDCWLVPEKTEDGEHVYSAPTVETFTFNFSNDKDKGKIPGDTDMPGEQNLPTEGELIPPPAPEILWDDVPSPLPPDFPFMRDLAVMPVFTVGSNAMVRVKNLGHVSNNFGRRLFVKKLALGSLPQDMGPIGPLFHYSVKTFFLIGLAPGNYVAFITPDDDLPYDFNDKRLFSITGASYSDAAVLPVGFAAGKVWIRIKNVGTAPMAAGRNLMTQKLPGGPLVDHGPIGALAVNAIHPLAGLILPAGNYRAFVTLGDAAPHSANDQRLFAVAAAALADFDVLPIFVSAGHATIKIKNVGLADAGAGAHLKTKKFPAGPLVDHGPIGALAVGASKVFPAIPLAPGLYKAMVTPGDAPPLNGNDSEAFVMPVYIDRDILPVSVVGGMATIKIKNIGSANALAGAHLKTKKLPAGPIIDHGPVGALNAGDTKVFLPIPLVGGSYRAFIDAGDAAPYHFNDNQNFNVGTFIDHDILPVLVASGKATIKVKNIGSANAPAGTRLKTQKLPGGPIIDHGAIGALNAGDTRMFLPIPLAPGSYKAFVSPGDAPPNNVNDSQPFIMPAIAMPDLEVSFPSKVGAKVKATIKNNGLAVYPAGGGRTWHLEKFVLGVWTPIPIIDPTTIPMIPAAGTFPVQGSFTGNGNYRIRITPGDGTPGNDTKTKVLP